MKFCVCYIPVFIDFSKIASCKVKVAKLIPEVQQLTRRLKQQKDVLLEHQDQRQKEVWSLLTFAVSIHKLISKSGERKYWNIAGWYNKAWDQCVFYVFRWSRDWQQLAWPSHSPVALSILVLYTALQFWILRPQTEHMALMRRIPMSMKSLQKAVKWHQLWGRNARNRWACNTLV